MGTLRQLMQGHPQLTAWVALAVGMVAVLLVAVREVALLPTQLAVLVVSTIILAGLCVWIIHWEDQ
jgi:hypothetical protein